VEEFGLDEDVDVDGYLSSDDVAGRSVPWT
jgi:hypothetical protein